MNIKITHNWLLEYLETDAKPEEIKDYLSLSGPSIESVTALENDFVYDIEIISNRIDYASVLGIAQEAVAILPWFGKKAKLKINPLELYRFKKYDSNHDRDQSRCRLDVKILEPRLCSRFGAVIIDNIQIKPSPNFISQRLINCGIKSINNVVDISNYLMLALGQPVHIFDYDQIKKQTMAMRSSKKGEKITTLDEKEIALPGGDIVIEDGDGRLIDLCGIMGGLNSAVTNKTKRVLLFVQTYNKELIRRTTMATGVRTVAANFFEKGMDEERVEPTMVYGIKLIEQHAAGKAASKIVDIYPKPYTKKTINIDYDFFAQKIGVNIDKKQVDKILLSLGFALDNLSDDRTKNITVSVPSWRQYDINIKEDLVEEVARIYGYHNIPSVLQPPAYVEQPKDMEEIFLFQNKIKLFLKHLGLNEAINYSMISKKMIDDFGLKINEHLRLSNSISEDIEYLRTSLLPSLYKNAEENKGKKEVIRFFEIAKVYHARSSRLPDEIYRLGIITNTDYFDLKGIIEALYKELNIEKTIDDIIEQKDNLFMVEIDLKKLVDNYRPIPKYKPITPYAVIKLDKTFELSQSITYEVIQRLAQQSKLLQKIEAVDLFKNKLTLRFYYSSPNRNLTEEEAKQELAKVSA